MDTIQKENVKNIENKTTDETSEKIDNVFERKEPVFNKSTSEKPRVSNVVEKPTFEEPIKSIEPKIEIIDKQQKEISNTSNNNESNIEQRLEAIESNVLLLGDMKISISNLEKQIDIMATQLDETIEEESLAISKLPNKFNLLIVSFLSSIITVALVVLAIAVLPVLYPDLPAQLTGMIR